MRRSRAGNSGRKRPQLSKAAWLLIGVEGIGLALSTAFLVASGGRSIEALAVASSLLAFGLGVGAGIVRERLRWSPPVRTLARNLSAFNDDPGDSWDLPGSPTLAELIAPIRELQAIYLSLRGRLDVGRDDPPAGSDDGELSVLGPIEARMTRSGTFEPPVLDELTMATGDFSTLDMINRLDPRTLRWLDSSLSEQVFLGWSLDQLKEKSFLDVVQEDDRKLAKQQLRAVLERGEGHGLIYRISTAKGETRAVELNIGVRYAADGRVLHLRCHLADVTTKLRDESELRRRTKELTRANDDLRRANKTLEKLKDRYSDLYENAPAMYFSVDRLGRFLECNNTLIRTLGFTRKGLLGRPVQRLRAEADGGSGGEGPAEIPRPGPVEYEAEWAKSDGQVIAVWVTGSAIPGPDGAVRNVRCVAQDVTARRALEAELKVKNERLALANLELSRKNKELDEFTHVVSHDLQEPVRTLIGFSEFLMRDHGDKLDESARGYVRHLVDASKRLRTLIRDLLTLSKAGEVTAGFREVDLEEVVATIRADLAGLIRSKDAVVCVLGPLPRAWGDRDRIGQLLANLVANGLKYNKSPHPRVEIRATGEERQGVTLSIRDNGIGIEPQFHSKIFRPFRRLHTREEYEGTGAGLAICLKIARAHGGRIWVDSEPGLGSTFHLTLPGTAGPGPIDGDACGQASG